MNRKVTGLTAIAVLLMGTMQAQAQPPSTKTKPGNASASQSGGKSQTELALKSGNFEKIVATDSRVMGATRTNDLAKAKTLVGKAAAFQGTVAKVFAPRGNSLVLLNFDKNYKSAISGVVRAKDFAKFPDLTLLEGKKILIIGKVIDFHGQPEVEVSKATDIKLIP